MYVAKIKLRSDAKETEIKKHLNAASSIVNHANNGKLDKLPKEHEYMLPHLYTKIENYQVYR